MTMEAPGFLMLVYTVHSLSGGVAGLPWRNQVLTGLFVIHYIYRAIVFPLLQPSMAPIHLAVWTMALTFQLLNASCLGAWLAVHGPTTAQEWTRQSPLPQFILGLSLFYAGLAANFFHDEELREIRRRRLRRLRHEHRRGGDQRGGGYKGGGYYEIPSAGLFRYILYPHYLCEWVEWTGFLVAAGWTCTPAWAFLVNEIFSMLPRAVRGRAWYIHRFGRDKVGRRRAVIPGLL